MTNFKEAVEAITAKTFGGNKFGKAIFNIEEALAKRGVDVNAGDIADTFENNR